MKTQEETTDGQEQRKVPDMVDGYLCIYTKFYNI